MSGLYLSNAETFIYISHILYTWYDDDFDDDDNYNYDSDKKR